MSQGFVRDYLVNATGETAISINGLLTASTSGTEIDFTIPAGVKEFSIMCKGCSTASADINARVGKGGTPETTGYIGGAQVANSSSSVTQVFTTGIRMGHSSAAGTVLNGILTFKLMDESGEVWCWSGNFVDSGDTNSVMSAGYIDLSGELDIVRLYSSSTFDAGSVNISYENPDLAVSTQSAGSTDVFINGVKQASTSGTSIDFTGIPAGVKEIKVMFEGVSTSGSSDLMVQLGDSGGFETTGYLGSVTNHVGTVQNGTTGINITASISSGAILNGFLHMVLLDASSNLWVAKTTLALSNSASLQDGATSKPLSDTLDRIRITTLGGSNTFDLGSINIQYDNPALKAGTPTQFGKLVQMVNTQIQTIVSCPTILPADNTIPQNTEGDEVMTLAITPTSSTNNLKIEVNVVLGQAAGGAGFLGAALFQDDTAAALASTCQREGTATGAASMSFTYWMAAGTTSSTTFKVRCGNHTTSNAWLNGYAASTTYHGGVEISSITITEIEA